MRLLTDENIASSVVCSLRQAGFSVLDVKEKKWYGMTDAEVTRVALRERRIIVTHDSDFLLQQSVSAIILRFSLQRPRVIAQHLITFLSSHVAKKRMRKKVRVVLFERYAEFHF